MGHDPLTGSVKNYILEYIDVSPVGFIHEKNKGRTFTSLSLSLPNVSK